MSTLTAAQLKHALRKYDDWKISTKALKKDLHFSTFTEATAFVASLGPIADGLNHHPGILIDYTTVKLTLSSHDAGGVTDRDIELAKAIEEELSLR